MWKWETSIGHSHEQGWGWRWEWSTLSLQQCQQVLTGWIWGSQKDTPLTPAGMGEQSATSTNSLIILTKAYSAVEGFGIMLQACPNWEKGIPLHSSSIQPSCVTYKGKKTSIVNRGKDVNKIDREYRSRKNRRSTGRRAVPIDEAQKNLWQPYSQDEPTKRPRLRF